MALETSSGYKTWWQWDDGLQRRVPAALAAARTQHAEEIAFWQFVQWQFDAQLGAVKKYANDRGVSIMGDLPIFVAHHSADVWARPDLYTLDENFQPTVVAGCPPDAMAVDGQRWGNPHYHWDRMAKEDFAWWTARVRRALEQADVFRIDHFRGFAGYYEIPASCPTAREGTWRTGPGKPLFDAIARALGPLPIVAEDLGFITQDVYDLRDSLGYPGMRILQFAFGDDAGNDFLPHNYVANTDRLHRHARQRHRARLVGQREPARARLRRQLPGHRRRRHPLGDDPRLLQLGGQHRRVPAAGRAGPGQRAPHEHAGHRERPELVVALRLADAGHRAGPRAGADQRGQRARADRARQTALSGGAEGRRSLISSRAAASTSHHRVRRSSEAPRSGD